MKKYLSILIAGTVALYSCSITEINGDPVDEPQCTGISVGLVSEIEGISEDTKAYLNQQDETVWNYVWEDGDEMGFFQFRNGAVLNQGRAEVDKRPTGTKVLYPAADFKNGDAIYTYMYQKEAEGILADQGIVNDNPYDMWMHIPSTQSTSTEPEIFSYTDDFSFDITNINMTYMPNVSKQGTSYDNVIGFQAPSGKIKFKIKGYDRNLEYGCTGADNLVIDYYGNAEVTLTPDAIDATQQTNQSTKNLAITTTYYKEYPIDIYVVGYEDKAARITVKADITHKTGIAHMGLVTPSLNINYTKESRNASIVIDQIIEGDVKPYPVRNCMPCVSKRLNLTNNMIKYPDEIQSYMTMYMLGSVIEFRVFSTDNEIGVGEDLFAVMFNASDNCAGNCKYNMVGSDLMLTDMTESFVMATDEDGKTIQNGKPNYVSLYMVIAPGDYSAEVNFVTMDHVYTFNMGTKTFSRAVKKAINCDLASSSCSVQTLNEFFGIPEDVETGDEDESGTESAGEEEDEM